MAKGIIKRDWDDAAQVIIANFPDGTKESFSFADLADREKIDCGMHGMEQKVFDSIAGDIKAGQSFDQIKATLRQTYTNLKELGFEGRRGSSEGPSLTLLTEAVARLMGRTVEEAKAKLATQTVEQRRAFGSLPQVKAVVDAIRAERSAAKAAVADQTSTESLQGLFA